MYLFYNTEQVPSTETAKSAELSQDKTKLSSSFLFCSRFCHILSKSLSFFMIMSILRHF